MLCIVLTLHRTNEHWIMPALSARKGLRALKPHFRKGGTMLKRNIKITFRLNAKEHQRLKKCVKKTGLSQETYIRTLLNSYAPKEMPPPDYHGMMRELNAIGNSMNQIAARANTTGFFLAEEYAMYMQEFRHAVLAIQKAVTQPEQQ